MEGPKCLKKTGIKKCYETPAWISALKNHVAEDDQTRMRRSRLLLPATLFPLSCGADEVEVVRERTVTAPPSSPEPEFARPSLDVAVREQMFAPLFAVVPVPSAAVLDISEVPRIADLSGSAVNRKMIGDGLIMSLASEFAAQRAGAAPRAGDFFCTANLTFWNQAALQGGRPIMGVVDRVSGRMRIGDHTIISCLPVFCEVTDQLSRATLDVIYLTREDLGRPYLEVMRLKQDAMCKRITERGEPSGVLEDVDCTDVTAMDIAGRQKYGHLAQRGAGLQEALDDPHVYRSKRMAFVSDFSEEKKAGSVLKNRTFMLLKTFELAWKYFELEHAYVLENAVFEYSESEEIDGESGEVTSRVLDSFCVSLRFGVCGIGKLPVRRHGVEFEMGSEGELGVAVCLSRGEDALMGQFFGESMEVGIEVDLMHESDREVYLAFAMGRECGGG